MTALLEAPVTQAQANPPQLWFETPPTIQSDALAKPASPQPILPKPRGTAPVGHDVEAPKPNMRTSVFAAEGKARSPWSGPMAPPPFTHAHEAEIHAQSKQPSAVDGGIDGVRKLLFGNHLTEMQARLAEAQLSMNGEMRRARESVMARVDEMAALLHRDMVVLREEMRGEITQLKTDLFTAATGLSSVKDRLGDMEVKLCGETSAALAELSAGLESKEAKFDKALAELEERLRGTIESKSAEALATLAKKTEIAGVLAQLASSLNQEDAPAEKPAGSSLGSPLEWFSPKARRTGALKPDTGLIGGEEKAPNTMHDWASVPNPFLADSTTVT